MSDAIKPAYWMTYESRWRMAQGGNSKGAVPVHGRRSVTADIPLYDQSAIDAAVAAERERCAKLCEEVEDQAWALWKAIADPIEQGRNIGAQHCADAIRQPVDNQGQT